ncbi:MAG: glycosyltransferase family 2 protein [Bacillota bacterium]
MNRDNPVLGIVVPCYNEQEVLMDSFKRLDQIYKELIVCKKISKDSFILFVDDGSKDKTWEIITSFKENHTHVKGMKLSKNFGHQNAVLAGMISAKESADCIISIDADLQQDPKTLYEFIAKYREGYDIVYGVRNDRSSDSLYKKTTALSFYKLMSLMGVELIRNHADFRLVSRRVLDALSDYKEVNLFLRGIFPTLGFRETIIYHDVTDRLAGESKYSIKKMLSLALNGITSFSIMPIRFITITGFVLFVFSLMMSGYVFYAVLFKKTVLGWASTVLPIYFIGGVQLLSLGLIGEYIGKIYLEVKRRPRFIVEEEI